MAKIINVLSLFDGMSCGRQALERANIKVGKYYASEIDKHAIKVTQHNYPDTIQLGSVVDIDVSQLEPIDLLIGGSPCQSFSFAGKRNGMTTTCNEEIHTLEKYLELKNGGFKFEGESYLFWEYMRILTDIRKYNPNVLFLLENVEMGNKWERVLSEAIGICGVHINSALVSAQNRKRIYWTNIRTKEEGLFSELHSDIPQPEDRGILLKDILEDEVDEKYYLSDKMLKWLDKHSEKRGVDVKKLDGEQKTSCLTATAQVKQNLTTDYVCVPMRGNGENNEQPLSSITIPEATSKGYVEIEPGECFDAENINSKTRRGRKMKDKSNCLMAKETDFMRYEGVDFRKNYAVIGSGYEQDNRAYYENGKSGTLDVNSKTRQKVLLNYEHSLTPDQLTISNVSSRIRRLTPVECERLQTVEDNYTAVVSDTQRYKMLGNGWNIETIAHILKFINKDK